MTAESAEVVARRDPRTEKMREGVVQKRAAQLFVCDPAHALSVEDRKTLLMALGLFRRVPVAPEFAMRYTEDASSGEQAHSTEEKQ